MTDNYNPQAIEPKWQQRWEEQKLYRAEVDWDKPKHYALTMLPYPSGDLHIGHWFSMTPPDARARYMRMKGYNVLFPMGFDAFGLPAEEAAISRNIHPWKWTYANIERMRDQMRSMGTMFDWEREAISCTPEYYKWSEWFFKKFYQNDLAYRGEALVNWSPTLQTVLANEQVIDGKDERHGQPVIQRMMTQWFFRTSTYADELLDFSDLDWPEPIKIMQTNWIGRSEGAKVNFKSEQGDDIEIFTTRPDTLWGATFMVLAPEHPLVAKLTTADKRETVENYVVQTAKATEIERMAEDRVKTGEFIGAYAINPVNNARIPIWIADYVMIGYGTGAIMAVPAHDQRDFEFARKFGLNIQVVIQPEGETLDDATMEIAYVGEGTIVNSDSLDGTPVNTEKGRKNPSIDAAIRWLEDNNCGKEAVNYRLRDWLISRQRYWGSPIPMIHRADGSVEPVADADLPVTLPEDVEFLPTGRSPLTYHEPFFNTHDRDGNEAKRETDTMDTFMCSSWYQLRYLSPQYDVAPFDPEEAAYWLPVDVYTGGAEHATMHLLYTRWFTKVLRDIGIFDDAKQVAIQHGRDPEDMFDEPMLLLRNQGQVLGAERKGDYLLVTGTWNGNRFIADHIQVIEKEDAPEIFDGVVGELLRRTENILTVGEAHHVVETHSETAIDIPSIPGVNRVEQLKHHLDIQRMSKSKGNVINPDELVKAHGADVVRAYLMFAFDWQKGGPWDPKGVQGVTRWLNDVWNLVMRGTSQSASGEQDVDVERKLHQTIERVERSLEQFSFNTAIAALMELKNTFRSATRDNAVSKDMWHTAMNAMLRLMAPFTPHIAEELWYRLGYADSSIHVQAFPVYDPAKAAADTVTLVVMVAGKPRDRVEVAADIAEEEAKQIAISGENAQRFLDGKEPKRVIFIPGRKGQEPKVNIVP